MKLGRLTLISFLLATVAVAQKGTAGSGFYPMGYVGDTWTGEVTATDEDKRELTLTYKKGDKTQTFVAFIPNTGVGWMTDEEGDRVIAIYPQDEDKDKKKDSNQTGKKPIPEPAHLNLQDLIGRRVTVYYISREKKVNEQKVKLNEVIRIKLVKK
jgi:DNA-binding beta-propeller fold protein YncE